MENSITNTTTLRKPIDVALLSLLTPGLGHVYAGSFKKGVILIALLYAVIYGAGLIGALPTFYGIASLCIFLICYYLYAIVSSVILARRTKNKQLNKYYHWYFYLAIFACIALVVSLLSLPGGRILGVKMFRTPSVSMNPILEVGEYVSADTRNVNPTIGDVVVYRYPNTSNASYIARVAAVGGDNLSIKEGVVFRNGKPEGVLEVAESLRESKYSNTMADRRIPENEIFVLGDNRDNSNDSRSRGTVRMDNVVGKVRYVLFSKATSRMGTEVK